MNVAMSYCLFFEFSTMVENFAAKKLYQTLLIHTRDYLSELIDQESIMFTVLLLKELLLINFTCTITTQYESVADVRSILLDQKKVLEHQRSSNSFHVEMMMRIILDRQNVKVSYLSTFKMPKYDKF